MANNNEARRKAFEAALSTISKTYKDVEAGIFSKLGENSEVNKISTGSLSLDFVLGGGAGVGRVIEIYGAESCGKTSIALTMIANVQKEGGNALFLDAEQAFDPNYARKLGVDLEKLGFAQPSIAEEALQIMKDAAMSGTTDIIVLDSVASLVPKAEAEQDMEKATIGLLARLLSKALKQLISIARKNNCTLVFLNQIRDNVGVMYGPATSTSGGRALKFYASQRIEVKKKEQVTNEKKEIRGNKVHFKCVKNKIARPYAEGTTVLTFNKGIDRAAEILTIGEEFGIITKEGRTYYTAAPEDKKYKIDGFGAVLTDDGRIKIASSSKAALTEIEKNKKLYDLIGNRVVNKFKELQNQQDFPEEYEEEDDTEDFEEMEAEFDVEE